MSGVYIYWRLRLRRLWRCFCCCFCCCFCFWLRRCVRRAARRRPPDIEAPDETTEEAIVLL